MRCGSFSKSFILGGRCICCLCGVCCFRFCRFRGVCRVRCFRFFSLCQIRSFCRLRLLPISCVSCCFSVCVCRCHNTLPHQCWRHVCRPYCQVGPQLYAIGANQPRLQVRGSADRPAHLFQPGMCGIRRLKLGICCVCCCRIKRFRSVCPVGFLGICRLSRICRLSFARFRASCLQGISAPMAVQRRRHMLFVGDSGWYGRLTFVCLQQRPRLQQHDHRPAYLLQRSVCIQTRL